jgi:hypothetical protein
MSVVLVFIDLRIILSIVLSARARANLLVRELVL